MSRNRASAINVRGSSDFDDLQLLVASGAQAAVAEIELLPKCGAEDFRCGARFTEAKLRCAASSHFAARQVDDSRSPPRANHVDDRATARELDVVGVRGKENCVDGFFHHRPTILNAGASGSTSFTRRSRRTWRYSHHHGNHATMRSCTC